MYTINDINNATNGYVLDMLPKVLAMQEETYVLKYVERKINSDVVKNNLDNYLDVKVIEQGFRKYMDGNVDKLHFAIWCKLVAKLYKFKADLLQDSMCVTVEYARKIVGYKYLQKELQDCIKNGNVDQTLANVLYHHRVLDGKEPNVYPLKSDFEIFENLQPNYNRRVVQINHYQKTYFLSDSMNDFWEEAFGEDFDDYEDDDDVSVMQVSQIVFDKITKGIIEAGYKRVNDFCPMSNLCDFYIVDESYWD